MGRTVPNRIPHTLASYSTYSRSTLSGIAGIVVAMLRRIPFSFPNPVDEVSARLVATGVVTMGAGYLITRSPLILVLLAYGFAARVMFGPRFSPLGRLVTRALRPRLRVQSKFVAGAPKRFAQGIGLVFSAGALVAWAG